MNTGNPSNFRINQAYIKCTKIIPWRCMKTEVSNVRIACRLSIPKLLGLPVFTPAVVRIVIFKKDFRGLKAMLFFKVLPTKPTTGFGVSMP